jgi:ABC transporter substrate binding protein
MKIFFSPSYTIATHSFETTRKSRWIAESLAREPIAGIELVAPEPTSAAMLSRVHDPEYVDAVRKGSPRDSPSPGASLGIQRSGKWYAPQTAALWLPPSRHSAPTAFLGRSQSGLHHARRARDRGMPTSSTGIIASDRGNRCPCLWKRNPRLGNLSFGAEQRRSFNNLFDLAENAGDGSRMVLVLSGGPSFGMQRAHIADLAIQHRLPTMFTFKYYVEAGGLMSYGIDTLPIFRRAASFVAKILRGAKPSDLPVEQPTNFEFTLNLKTAKAIGVSVPTSILLRADEVIE